ncbi:MAG: type II toxin-antitoxin system prevent-host-death family antitoxin, partial [Armatimonadetes bacterium]|nr:type II toxin-antitoxin system prevent-host-death family antitoxin [Armatimonadota bacterium]
DGMISDAVGVFEAKTHLSALIEQVRHGRRFTITKRGEPVAELGPVSQLAGRAQRGSAKSPSFHMSADFDAPLDDFADYM